MKKGNKPYVTSIALEDYVSIKEHKGNTTLVRHYPASYV